MMFPSYSQPGHLYGIWLDAGTQKFVSVDEASGERTEISNITGNPGVVNGSSAFCADSGHYIFAGFPSTQPKSTK